MYPKIREENQKIRRIVGEETEKRKEKIRQKIQIQLFNVQNKITKKRRLKAFRAYSHTREP